MKSIPILLALTLAAATTAPGQGTLIYDQQSSTEATILGGSMPSSSGAQPLGQSFVPSLSGIDFVGLWMFALSGNSTFNVNLRADSITGSILGTSSPVTSTGNFAGRLTFFFPSTIPLTPGTTYY